jgi:hypothetical protein
MDTVDVEALALIADAPVEATRKALAVYPAQPLPDKTIVMVRARGLVFTKYGNAGINTLIFSAANAARAAAKRAELRDHWDWRVIEIATENLVMAQMVKSWLKPSEFEMLMKPWASFLGEPWISIEGCDAEVAPKPEVHQHAESTKDRKARERKEAIVAHKAEKDAAADARAIARAEKKKQPKQSIRQRAQHEMAEKRTTGQPAHKPAAVVIDLVSAITGEGAFPETATANVPETIKPAPSLVAPKPFLSDGMVRLMWWKRDECWKIILPAPSKATAVATHFDTQELAQSYADEQGWSVVGVVTPKEWK